MKTEKLTFDSYRNDLDLISEEHYNKQMSVVRTILNLGKKGLTVREIGMKVIIADSYIKMVIEKGEKEMGKYWEKMYEMKEKYEIRITNHF